MRRLAPLLGALALSFGALYWAWNAQQVDAPAEIDAAEVTLPELPEPVQEDPVVLPPPRTPEEELAAVAARARALLLAGRSDEAVLLLETWRKRLPAAFEAGATAKLLVEASALAQPETEEADERVARRFRASRKIAASARDSAARARLERHVDLFVPRPRGTYGAGTARDWRDGPYRVHVEGERTWATPAALLGVADAEAAEVRRAEQLSRLASRGATELLEPVHGALLWLALHQGEDGRISDASAAKRCKALEHGADEGAKTCHEVWGGSRGTSETAATALALLAFLDFRDQDAKQVFEPTIAQATRWLAAQQQKNGLFAGGRNYYVSAISLMALAQAAATSGSEALRGAVGKGLEGLHACRGPHGGYRYRSKQPGDLSVTGWVAQAVEAARVAEAPIPEGMEEELQVFLGRVWVRDEQFSYLERGNKRRSLYPVGMLMSHILGPQQEDVVLDTWRGWLPGRGKERPPLYTLYYGVRMSLVLHEGLQEPWRAWVGEVAERQVREDSAAGLFPKSGHNWVELSGGCVVTLSLTTLTLEHALYER